MCALRRTVHAGGDRPDPLRQVPGAHAPGAGLAAAAAGDRRLHASARAGRGPLLALLAGRGRAGAGGGAQALAPLRARPERGAALPRRGAAPRRGARAGPSQPGAADHRGRAPRLRLLPRLPDRRRADARRRAALARPGAAGPRAPALRAALRLRDVGRRMHDDLEALLACLLAKDPAHRFGSADEAAAMMRAIIPIAATAPMEDESYGFEDPVPVVEAPQPEPEIAHAPPQMLPPAFDPALVRAMMGEVPAPPEERPP